MNIRSRNGSKAKARIKRTDQGARAQFRFPVRPFGPLAGATKDNSYVFEHGHLFTSSSVARRVNMSCYAMIVLTAREAPFILQVGQEAKAYTAVVIRPSMQRAVYAENVKLTSFHVNPLHPMFPVLCSIRSPTGVLELSRSNFTSLNDDLECAYEGRLSFVEAARLFDTVLNRTCEVLGDAPEGDPRVDAVAGMLRQQKPPPLATLAASVNLSPHRLTHLFTQQIGISIRSYVLWWKMHQVPILLSAGKSLTQAAHECGFADSPHLAAAFKNVYGAPPSYFFNSEHVNLVTWLQPDDY